MKQEQEEEKKKSVICLLSKGFYFSHFVQTRELGTLDPELIQCFWAQELDDYIWQGETHSHASKTGQTSSLSGQGSLGIR